MQKGDQRSGDLTLEEADDLVRQLWMLVVSARYSEVSPADEEEVARVCHDLVRGVAGFEGFNRAAVRLCERVTSRTSLRGTAPYDRIRVDGLLYQVDHLRSLLRQALAQRLH